jgi:GTPase Era involved in 16S rRNA processing
MSAEGELMDLNQRIRNFEKIAVEFAEIFSDDISDSSKIENLAREMEQLRKKLDKDFESHQLESFLKDAKMLDRIDEAIDEHLIQDLQAEAQAIDKEIKDLASKAES